MPLASRFPVANVQHSAPRRQPRRGSEPVAHDARRDEHLGGRRVGGGSRPRGCRASSRRPGEAAGAIEGIVLTHSHRGPRRGSPPLDLPAIEAVQPAGGPRAGRPVRGDHDARPLSRPASACSTAACMFTGDTVLGAGSVFVSPGEGSLSAYLESLEPAAHARARRDLSRATARSSPTLPQSCASTATTASSARRR